jgi:DNA-binding transcriptional ArsR family regulator
MNILSPVNGISKTLACISQPARIQILMSLSLHEACVCHLETALGLSQASISQHLMILRKSGLVVARRDGRHIYYSLSNPALLDVFRQTAKINGVDLRPFERSTLSPLPGCPCPMCMPDSDPKLVCKKVRKERKITA